MSTVGRELLRRDLTMKTLVRVASRRDEAERTRFQLDYAQHYTADQLVSIDETGVDVSQCFRKKGRSPKGTRAVRFDVLPRGRRFSVLPAISINDGVLLVDVTSGTNNTETFNNFILRLLDRMNPYPESNSVILMDNLNIHRSELLEAEVERRGMRVLFTPKYSPDLNPIEEGFSCFKAWLRNQGQYAHRDLAGGVDADPHGLLAEGIHAVMTPERVTGWFRHCGYIS